MFISIFSVEGKSAIPDANEYEREMARENSQRQAAARHGTVNSDSAEPAYMSGANVYKKLAEYCLDISEVYEDQLVH